jgi:hypothetical protein
VRDRTSPFRTSSVSRRPPLSVSFYSVSKYLPHPKLSIGPVAILLENDRSGGEAGVGPAFVTKILFFVSANFAGWRLTMRAHFSSILLHGTGRNLIRAGAEGPSVEKPSLVPTLVTKSSRVLPGQPPPGDTLFPAIPAIPYSTNSNYSTVKRATKPSRLVQEIDGWAYGKAWFLAPAPNSPALNPIQAPPIPNTSQVKGLQAPTPTKIASLALSNCSLLVGQVRMCPGIDIQAPRGTLPQPWSSSVPSISSPEPDTVWSTKQDFGSPSVSFDRVGLHLGCSWYLSWVLFQCLFSLLAVPPFFSSPSHHLSHQTGR